MTYTIIVHEDGEPFVNIQHFKRGDVLKLMVARTHNALLDDGYAIIAKEEREDQRVMTYAYVGRKKEKGHKIYVSVFHE